MPSNRPHHHTHDERSRVCAALCVPDHHRFFQSKCEVQSGHQAHDPCPASRWGAHPVHELVRRSGMGVQERLHGSRMVARVQRQWVIGTLLSTVAMDGCPPALAAWGYSCSRCSITRSGGQPCRILDHKHV